MLARYGRRYGYAVGGTLVDTTTAIVTLIVSVFGASGFWTLVQKWYEKKSGRHSDIETAVLAIMHDRLYALCREHLEKGEISADSYENINNMYLIYRKMGGNHLAKKYVEKLNEEVTVRH